MNNLPALLELVEKSEYLCVALQEIWLRDYNAAEKMTRYLPTYKWIIKTPDKKKEVEELLNATNLSFHGVAVGVSNKYTESLTEINIESNRMIGIKLEVGGKKLAIFNLYLPTRGKDKEFEDALECLATAIEDLSGESQLILMGDLNVDTDSAPKRLEMWRKFCIEYSLQDNRRGHVTHFHKNSGRKNELDRYVTRSVELKNIRVVEDIGNSSHSPVMATYEHELQEEIEEELGGKCETKVNIQKLKENLDEFQQITNDLAVEMYQLSEDLDLDRDTFNAALSNIVFKAAIHCTGQKEYVSQKPRRRRKFKIDRKFYEDMRRAKKDYHQAGRPRAGPMKKAIRDSRKRMKIEIKRLRDEEEKQFNLDVITAARKKSPKIFSILKRMKQKEDSPTQLPSFIEGYGKTYRKPHVLEGFKELFTIQTMMDEKERYDKLSFRLAKIRVEAQREIVRRGDFPYLTMKREEYDKLTEKLKGDKAQDVFGLSNDLVKLVGDDMKELMFSYIRECLEQNDVGGLLRNFGKGTVIEKKKGLPITNIKNHRKIVSNNELNVILQLHIQPSVEEKTRQVQTRFQLGFTAGIPVMSAVIQRLELARMARAAGVELYLVVLDLKSCFPSISRDHMLELAADVLSPAEWSVIDQVYTDTYGELRIQSQASKPMFANRGSIEGGILSTQILKIFISVLLALLDRAGFTGAVNLHTLEMEPGQIVAADDILGWTFTRSDVQEMLNICAWWSNQCGSEFSIDKSNVVRIGPRRGGGKEEKKFILYGSELEEVEVSEHLGVPVTREPVEEAVIKKRERNTRRAMASTISYMNPSNDLPVFVKLEVWKKTYKSILLFSFETCNLTAQQMSRIEMFQIKALRAIFRVNQKAKMVLLRLLAGTASMWYDIWKVRLGSLNSILVGETIVKDYILLALVGGVSRTWSYKTVQWLHSRLGDKLDIYEFLQQPKLSFKTGARAIMRGLEFRKLREKVESSSIHRVPLEPYKHSLPLTMSDFSHHSQRLVRAYATVYSGSFHRNFSRACYLCEEDRMTEEEKKIIEDNTEHMLSGQCKISQRPKVLDALADVIQTLERVSPSHCFLTEVSDQRLKTSWLLNPCCETLGSNRISPEELQSSGLDNELRKFFYSCLTTRYDLLRKKGFDVKRWH